MSNASEPFGAVDLPLERVAAPEGEPRRLERADGAVLEATVASTASSTSRSGDERVEEAADLVDLADEVAGEIDHVRAEVAERSRSPPRAASKRQTSSVGVAPVLEVAPAEVPDLAELARLDQLAREAHGRDEAVVERAQVLDAGRRDALPDLVALVGVAPERLLADDVLARLGGGDRRLGVERVRAEVVEQPDRGSATTSLPVRRPALEAVAAAASPTASSSRPAIATSRGMSGGGQVMYPILLEARSSAPCP